MCWRVASQPKFSGGSTEVEKKIEKMRKGRKTRKMRKSGGRSVYRVHTIRLDCWSIGMAQTMQ